MMTKLQLLFLCLPFNVFGQFCDSLLLQSITNPGQFTVNNFDENSGILNGSYFDGSTIYYPENTGNVLLPSIVMVPGFMNTELTIQNWGSFFASYGIVTMTIGTNSLTDGHIERRDALLDAIVSLKNENQRLTSPLYSRIDTSSIAVGGFSKGGGGAQLVPALYPNIKAIVSLYPWLENPTISELNHSVPIIIISGQLDVIAPPSLHADIHYNYTPITTNKLKYEIAFASHDAISGPYAGSGEVGVRVLSWLQTYLLGDSCYCPIITLNASTSSSYITNVECNNMNVSISTTGSYPFKKLLKITNIYGNETTETKNAPLFYIYDDGTIEKKVVIE
jgi:predicted esterase